MHARPGVKFRFPILARLMLVALPIVVGLLTQGCASSKIDFSCYVYPPPPDTARLQLVDIYHSTKDFGSSVLTVLAGESRDEGLREPSGVAFDTSGNIAVADMTLGLCIFDRKTHELRRYADGSMRSPVGVAVDSRNNYYVTDSKAKAILLFGGDGQFRRMFGPSGMFDMPVGIVLDRKRERIYVSDSKKNQIFILNMAGDSIGVMVPPGDTILAFNKPTYMALDTAGNLYVTDVMNFRIQVLSPEGKRIRMFGKPGDALGDFQRPRGVAVDRDNHVWVTDALFQNFQIFNSAGKLLTFVGQFGQGPGEFNFPAGMASDGRFVAVVDQLNQRIQLFEYLGDPK